MGRLSPEKKCIIIYCRPELHDKFYRLKKKAHILLQRKLTNREFLDHLLNVYAHYLAEDERRRVIRSY
jgi:hypothetical protein